MQGTTYSAAVRNHIHNRYKYRGYSAVSYTHLGLLLSFRHSTTARPYRTSIRSREMCIRDRAQEEYEAEMAAFAEETQQLEFDIAFLNRAALERHGYDTATITDGDLQELEMCIRDSSRAG